MYRGILIIIILSCLFLTKHFHEVAKRVLQPVGKIRIFQQNFLRLLFLCFQGYTRTISSDQYAIYYRINTCNLK